MFIYRYDRVVVAGDVIYPQQGGWEGGPIELVRQFPECTYMRYRHIHLDRTIINNN